LNERDVSTRIPSSPRLPKTWPRTARGIFIAQCVTMALIVATQLLGLFEMHTSEQSRGSHLLVLACAITLLGIWTVSYVKKARRSA
jgi:hypothetical protein